MGCFWARRRIGQGICIQNSEVSLDLIVREVRNHTQEADVDIRREGGETLRQTILYDHPFAAHDDVEVTVRRYLRQGKGKGRQVWMTVSCPQVYRLRLQRYDPPRQ